MIEVGIVVAHLIKDEIGRVALGENVLVAVALEDEEGGSIEHGQACAQPSQEVVIDVAAPLSDDFGGRAVVTASTINDTDDGKVGAGTTSADVDGGYIASALKLLFTVGHGPNFQIAVGFLLEPDVDESFMAHRLTAPELAEKYFRAAIFGQPFEVTAVEDGSVGGGESFLGVCGIFGAHNGVVAELASLEMIPRNHFEGQTHIPEISLIDIERAP